MAIAAPASIAWVRLLDIKAALSARSYHDRGRTTTGESKCGTFGSSALLLWLVPAHQQRTSGLSMVAGVLKQAAPSVDMRNMRGTLVACDAASIMELDNGRKLVQFVQKRGKLNPPGLVGAEFKYTEGNYSLIVDRVYPQRTLAGKTTEQIYGEGTKTAIPGEGYCFFSDPDFSKLTEFSCMTKTENADTKIVYRVSFRVDDISAKRNLQGSNEVPAVPTQNPKDKSFDRIFEYTIFSQTLPDGKHPVWVYYQAW